MPSGQWLDAWTLRRLHLLGQVLGYVAGGGLAHELDVTDLPEASADRCLANPALPDEPAAVEDVKVGMAAQLPLGHLEVLEPHPGMRLVQGEQEPFPAAAQVLV